ncbi:MAG: hypothetical protein DBY25_08495 [Clostridiales bacterium]|nr:MAG: hypothetical protein DBY25_08495 [Clostridiales bacterium]
MKAFKRFLPLLLSLVLLISLSNMTVLAGGQEYTDWASGTSLPSSGVYRLTTNVTLSQEVTIGSWGSSRPETPKSSLVLDLNGHTITAASGEAFFVQVTGGLTIEDNKGGGKITNAGAGSMKTLVQVNGGSFTMTGGTLENTTKMGYALHVNGNSIASISGGTIVNSGSSGYAAFVNGTSESGKKGGSLTLSGDGEIKNTIDGGKALQINGGNASNASLSMEGGRVMQESTYSSSSAIMVNTGTPKDGDQPIVISGGSITSNAVGIEADSAPITVTGGTFDVQTYAFQTRHTTITPQGENSVNVTAGKAIFHTLRDGSDNQINGGNFDAPNIKEAYTSDEPGDTPSKTVITGGSYTTSPVEYITADRTAVGYTEVGKDKVFLVGTGEEVGQGLASAPTGSQIEVLKGDVSFSIPVDGVTVTNPGGGNVTVNDKTVDENTDVVTHIHQLQKTEAKAPSCTEKGNVAYWYCAGCGKYFSDEGITEITKIERPALGHNYADAWTSDDGSHWHECTVCGDHTGAAAHISDEGVVTQPATETENGEKTYTCTICGKVLKTESIPATGSVELPNTNNTGNSSSGNAAPQTGDSNVSNLLALSILAAGAALASLLIIRRKADK